MTVGEFLGAVSELEGVEAAALLSPTGELLACVPEGASAASSELLGGSLASVRALVGLLGAEEICQMILEFDGGGLLLALSADSGVPPAEAPLSVVHLRSAQDVGRVRFSLRRLLPQLKVS